jgi:hypothetical protein
MNLLMKRIGANVTLPIMVVLWGIVCACQGAIFCSYSHLLISAHCPAQVPSIPIVVFSYVDSSLAPLKVLSASINLTQY